MVALYGDFPITTFLKTVESDHPLVRNGAEALRTVLYSAEDKVNSLLSKYRKFDYLLNEQQNVSSSPISTIRSLLQIYTDAKLSVIDLSMNEVQIAPLLIDCRQVKQLLETKVRNMLEALRGTLAERLMMASGYLSGVFRELHDRITADPGYDAGGWRDLKVAAETCYAESLEYLPKFDELHAIWNLMQEYHMSLSDSENARYWDTCAWPRKLESELQYTDDRLSSSRTQIIAKIGIDTEYFESSLTAYIEENDTYAQVGDVERAPDLKVQVESLRVRLDKLNEVGRSIKERVSLMGLKNKLPLVELEDLLVRFGRVEMLWKYAFSQRHHIATWLNSYFVDLDAENMIDTVTEWRQTLKILRGGVKEDSPGWGVLTVLSDQLDGFSRYMRVISCLRNPALREDHWEEISKVVGLSYSDIAGLKLKELVALDLELIQDIVLDVSFEATLEYRLESELEKMQKELGGREFSVVQFREFRFVEGRDLDAVFDMLDEYLVRCGGLMGETRSAVLVGKVEAFAG
ncbi:hypothetical protein HK097_005889, partial [Rhizophlyctis rosea]